MKNATHYEKKIRKLMSSMPRKAQPQPRQGLDAFTLMLEAILQADVPRKAAAGVIDELNREFVDYNELRVAPVKDITDCMPRDFPAVREKAESVVRSLNAIFDHASVMSMEHLDKMPKRDLRKFLAEAGLSPYAASLLTMVVFGGHAIPVDQSLMESLELEKMVHPRSDLADVQGFLERIIPQKDAYAAHEFFRDFVEKNYKALAKKRKLAAAKAAQAAKEAQAKHQEPAVQAQAALKQQAAKPAAPESAPHADKKNPKAQAARKGGSVKAKKAKGSK